MPRQACKLPRHLVQTSEFFTPFGVYVESVLLVYFSYTPRILPLYSAIFPLPPAPRARAAHPAVRGSLFGKDIQWSTVKTDKRMWRFIILISSIRLHRTCGGCRCPLSHPLTTSIRLHRTCGGCRCPLSHPLTTSIRLSASPSADHLHPLTPHPLALPARASVRWVQVSVSRPLTILSPSWREAKQAQKISENLSCDRRECRMICGE